MTCTYLHLSSRKDTQFGAVDPDVTDRVGRPSVDAHRIHRLHNRIRTAQAGTRDSRKIEANKGYVTNIPVTLMEPGEVIGKYHDLWHVEQSFRMSKTDLRARPMFHRTKDAIEAHLTIVFAALAVARCVQDQTGVAIARVVKQLRPLRTSTIAINGAVQDFPPQIPAAEQEILSRLGFETGY